ncbi:MAG: hypothetical protein IPK99_05850 [Flavobacteriales bacterium]|nr:hypothetical protein [Flavobacteriales bacterium]
MRCAIFALTISIPFGSSAQTAHLLRALDFFFLPDTLVMVAGDSVKFQTQGLHNITQVDQAAWLANQPIGNGGFHTTIGADSTFAIDTAGTYYFVCEPNSFMAMKGLLLVAPNGPTGLRAEDGTPSRLHMYPDPASDVLYIDLAPIQKPIEAVAMIDHLGVTHPIDFLASADRIVCEVRGLPRGHGVLCMRAGPIVIRQRIVLN